MKIWIDADACPAPVKEIVFRASFRLQTQVTLVANRNQHFPRSLYVDMVVVSKGFDEADHYLVENATPQDLVITADIPLAHLLVCKRVAVLSPRGEIFSEANIGERLAIRDLMTDLRSTGFSTGGPKAFNEQDKKKFAESFDKLLSQLSRSVPNSGPKV